MQSRFIVPPWWWCFWFSSFLRLLSKFNLENKHMMVLFSVRGVPEQKAADSVMTLMILYIQFCLRTQRYFFSSNTEHLSLFPFLSTHTYTHHSFSSRIASQSLYLSLSSSLSNLICSFIWARSQSILHFLLQAVCVCVCIHVWYLS